MNHIGEIIKCKRKKRKLTQGELAALLNVTPQAVSRWEMGVSYPDIAMIPLISKTLYVSADELLGITPSYDCQKSTENETGQDKPALTQSQADNIQNEPALTQSQTDSIFDGSVPVSGESKKVLIVDDAPFMRMMLEDILTKHGHTVLQAEDGQECLNILQKEAVDVCVLDIGMPGMDGLEVLKILKEEHPGLKVVMLSALSTKSNIETAKQLGADSFVVKPFQADLLVNRIG